ncbi:MAG: PHP domain-containing protein, partial [Lautropia sp.]|nr:PHP domain-containing protein [Lautropia sp.]
MKLQGSTSPGAHPDPWHLNVDLHCHSTVSDGTLAPREVVRRAHRNGVQALALTDHDEVGGLAAAADEAARVGLCFIPGVEVSVSWGDETIHVVGLRIDAQ